MPVLAFDTSSAVAVSLVEDSPTGAVLAARSVQEQRRHAELLAPLIVEVLTAGGVDRSAVTAVVVGTGPAPFTGLRAGLVTARTFALALGVPVHGICSLDALASQAVASQGLPAGASVLVVTDARRHEVYWARYRVTGGLVSVACVDGPGVVRPADLVVEPADVVVGRGALLHPELAAEAGGVARWGDDAALDPDPAVLARLALARVAGGERELPTEPLYLRRPDVVPSTAHKRVRG